MPYVTALEIPINAIECKLGCNVLTPLLILTLYPAHSQWELKKLARGLENELLKRAEGHQEAGESWIKGISCVL